MLDVGGGGGFFAKAFEDFGFGEATYIDLDSEACQFAREKMKLSHVICDDIARIEQHCQDAGFDFIYCRHVVEHLIDPVSLIKKCANLLTDDGVFVLQCPNGLSKEGLLFPRYWQKFLSKVVASNQWSWPRAFLFSLGPSYGWGLDPVRHLWAISEVGIKALFPEQTTYSARVYSASLVDPVYSPYWRPTDNWDRIAKKITKLTPRRLLPGVHLVAEIRKNGRNVN